MGIFTEMSRCLATKEGIHRHTNRQQRDLISLLFFQNKAKNEKKLFHLRFPASGMLGAICNA
jgi:hypothetical protein